MSLKVSPSPPPKLMTTLSLCPWQHSYLSHTSDLSGNPVDSTFKNISRVQPFITFLTATTWSKSPSVLSKIAEITSL